MIDGTRGQVVHRLDTYHNLSCSFSAASALAMCPGYHCTTRISWSGLYLSAMPASSSSSAGARRLAFSSALPLFGLFACVSHRRPHVFGVAYGSFDVALRAVVDRGATSARPPNSVIAEGKKWCERKDASYWKSHVENASSMEVGQRV